MTTTDHTIDFSELRIGDRVSAHRPPNGPVHEGTVTARTGDRIYLGPIEASTPFLLGGGHVFSLLGRDPSVRPEVIRLSSCPSWCAGIHDADSEVIVHCRPVGALGVEITAEESDDGTVGAACVYVPDAREGLSDDVTPERAALLGHSLLLAVAIIERTVTS
jgi:hypothetical protein